jgi:hypothetical protein
MSDLVQRKSFQPKDLEEGIKFSELLSKSALVPADYQGKPANVLVAIQWGMELGLQPLQALQNIAVINGRPSVYGDALLAMVRSDPRCLGVNEYQEGEGDERTAVCTVKRKHSGEDEEITRTFSVAQAKLAGLWGKRGPWTQYPERMLQHRARGNALRDGFPDVLSGLMTTEEVQDMAPMKDVTPSTDVTPPTIEELQQPKKVAKKTKPKKVVPEEQSIILLTMRDDDGKICIINKVKNSQDFCELYNNEMLRIARYENALPTIKRTKLKELEQSNIAVIDALPEELCAEMKDKRLQYNKHLSVVKEQP